MRVGLDFGTTNSSAAVYDGTRVRLLKLDPVDWNADALAKRALGKEAEKEAKARKNTVRKSGTVPAHPLSEYAGEYEHPGYGILKVALNADRLQGQHGA